MHHQTSLDAVSTLAPGSPDVLRQPHMPDGSCWFPSSTWLHVCAPLGGFCDLQIANAAYLSWQGSIKLKPPAWR